MSPEHICREGPASSLLEGAAALGAPDEPWGLGKSCHPSVSHVSRLQQEVVVGFATW